LSKNQDARPNGLDQRGGSPHPLDFVVGRLFVLLHAYGAAIQIRVRMPITNIDDKTNLMISASSVNRR